MADVNKDRQKVIREVFKESMETIVERESQYGSGAEPIAVALAAMFPEGVTLTTPEDHHRYFYILMIQMKLVRYARSFRDGGHDDSIHDAGNYAKLLEVYDMMGY